MSALTVAILADFAEERWPSMDLVAEMIADGVKREHSKDVTTTLLRPTFMRPLSRLPGLGGSRRVHNAERALNRYLRYPLHLVRRRRAFDLFHITDHSYSHLVNYLPPNRTVVTCHDLDTFRSVLEPSAGRYSAAFRAITRHILRGFQRAAIVICDSSATRDAVVANHLLPADRTVVIPIPVHPVFSPAPDPRADALAQTLLGAPHAGDVEIMHVGSTIPRKRIDTLLRTFAGLAAEFPSVRLVRVGGALTPEQRQLARGLAIEARIVEMPFVERDVLAAIYRRAAVVVLPSEAEGFGLPVIEALACRTPVLASDLRVLREVGGEAVVYRHAGDVPAWTAAAAAMLRERSEHPGRWDARRDAGVTWASRFSSSEYANRSVQLYRQILG